ISRFGGIIQFRNHKPLRFAELIEYSGCSLDPMEIFVASKITSVGKVARDGDGKALATFLELPAPCRPVVETIVERLRVAGIGGLVGMGEVNAPVCEVPVSFNKVGLVLQSGLNVAAAAAEAGIEVANRAMSGVIDYTELKSFWALSKNIGGG
ncbi:MAG: NrpR regulatory domain-containing protein, partial [Chloroflexota bacterium]